MRTARCSTCIRRSENIDRGSAARRTRCPGTWRAKQLEYTWQRTIIDRYVDFWRVTADGLDFALDAHGVDDTALREGLLNAYLSLDCYPEVPGVLNALKEAGLRTAILSNGSPMMLEAAVESAGIGGALDEVLSVDELGMYKPSPEVYQLATDALGVGRGQVSFQSSNAWDAAAAATFGFRVAWCNRFGQARERLPDAPGRGDPDPRRAAGHRAALNAPARPAASASGCLAATVDRAERRPRRGGRKRDVRSGIAGRSMAHSFPWPPATPSGIALTARGVIRLLTPGHIMGSSET